MKKYRILLTAGISLVVIGVGIIIFPHILNYMNESRMKAAVESFDERIDQMYGDTDTGDIDREIAAINASADTDYTIEDYVKEKNIKADENSQKYDWALISLLRDQMER